MNTNLLDRSLPDILKDKNSPWWEGNRSKIIKKAYKETMFELTEQLGSDVTQWHWGKVHVLEHKHPLAQLEILAPIFNVGPFPIGGGNEVINMMGFELNDEGFYQVNFGPAMRIVIDLADMENSYSVSPTGQSEFLFSDYYDNQAELFVQGKYRKQLMNQQEIIARHDSKLVVKSSYQG